MAEKRVVIGNENSGFKDLIFIPFTDRIKLTKARSRTPWVPNCGTDFCPLYTLGMWINSASCSVLWTAARRRDWRGTKGGKKGGILVPLVFGSMLDVSARKAAAGSRRCMQIGLRVIVDGLVVWRNARGPTWLSCPGVFKCCP